MLKKIFGRGGAWGPFILRLTLGTFSVVHGAQKLFGAFDGWGLDQFIKLVAGMGFKPPGLWAIVIVIIQFIGGIFLIFGIFTRTAALLIGIVTAVMITSGLLFPIEYPLVLIAISLSLLLTGGGRVALKD